MMTTETIIVNMASQNWEMIRNMFLCETRSCKLLSLSDGSYVKSEVTTANYFSMLTCNCNVTLSIESNARTNL